MNYLNKDHGWIITKNQSDRYKKENMIIEIIPAWQWMSDISPLYDSHDPSSEVAKRVIDQLLTR